MRIIFARKLRAPLIFVAWPLRAELGNTQGAQEAALFLVPFLSSASGPKEGSTVKPLVVWIEAATPIGPYL